MGRFVEEDIASYLEKQIPWLRRSSSVTDGSQNFFVGDMPLSPVKAASIYEYSGDLPEFTFGGVAVERPRIQITTRATAFSEARLMIHDIYDQLKDVGPLLLNGTTYAKIRGNSRPAEVAPDGENNNQFSCSFVIWRNTA
jgi:hypothetical protein